MNAKTALRERGLRVTAPRLGVLAALAEHPHADVETVAAATRAAVGKVSTQAVYDVLRTLTDVGLVRRLVSPARSSADQGASEVHPPAQSGSVGSGPIGSSSSSGVPGT